MKPPFPWNGAKTRMTTVLFPYLRAWGGKGRWIEPFLGSGVVSRMVRDMYPNTEHVIGDLNPWLMAAHQHWLTGLVEPPTLADVTMERIQSWKPTMTSDSPGPRMSSRSRRICPS